MFAYTAQSYGGIFSIGVPSSQMTLACVKLTWNYAQRMFSTKWSECVLFSFFPFTFLMTLGTKSKSLHWPAGVLLWSHSTHLLLVLSTACHKAVVIWHLSYVLTCWAHLKVIALPALLLGGTLLTNFLWLLPFLHLSLNSQVPSLKDFVCPNILIFHPNSNLT